MDPDKGVWVPCGETNGKTPEIDVDGLNEGTNYFFRVRAVNGQVRMKKVMLKPSKGIHICGLGLAGH